MGTEVPKGTRTFRQKHVVGKWFDTETKIDEKKFLGRRSLKTYELGKRS